MARPGLSEQMTTTEVGRHLGANRSTLINWINHGLLPSPTFIDSNGVQYFDQEWLKKAREIVREGVGSSA